MLKIPHDSKVQKYIDTYKAAQAAVRAVAPVARFGPSNWNTGTPTFKAQFMAQFKTVADSPTALGLSYYGSSGNGYTMESALRAYKQLTDMKAALPMQGNGTLLSISEFGTLTNAAHQASPEPGAFGAAWTLSAWIAALQSDIDEVYHWHDSDTLGQHTLLFGWTCLMALAEMGVGGQAAILSSTMPFELDASKAHNATSVMALSTQANSSTLLVFVACYNPTSYNSTAADLNVTLRLTSPIAATGQLSQYLIDANSAIYDNMWRDLAASDGLRRRDGHLYKLKDMANDAGQRHLSSQAQRYVAAQRALLQPQPFTGYRATLPQQGDAQSTQQVTELSTRLAAPAVLVIRVDSDHDLDQ